jgi:diguanylate cyclase (GGDEF)-like protein
MNLYGLPGFMAYSMLLCIAYTLIKQRKDESLKYWLAGWALIFLHASIFMLFSQHFPFDVIARGTLIVAGQAFILAAFYQEPTAINRSKLIALVAVSGALNLIFMVGSVLRADLQAADRGLTPFYVLIGAGAISAVWLAAVERSKPDWRFGVSAALAVLVYAVQAWLLDVYGLAMASQWLLCWTYLAVAYFFLRRRAPLTMGVIFTALSFVLWGLVFPVYSLLAIYAPDISNHIESEVWNLPKFLAAASMILALLEERVVSATHLASHDQLTGLPNRRLYVDRFEQAAAKAKRSRSGFGLLVIDLDKFKLVNDTLGHEAGDELLRVVSGRFRSVLRQVDTIARTGGDEFTIILDGVRSRADAEIVAEALRKCLEAPIPLKEGAYCASASIGAAVYPEDGATQTRLQAAADERMYARKEQRQAGAMKWRFPSRPNDQRSEQGLILS